VALDLLLPKQLMQFLNLSQHAAMPQLQAESELMAARKEHAA
jgi:hypothetical protein